MGARGGHRLNTSLENLEHETVTNVRQCKEKGKVKFRIQLCNRQHLHNHTGLQLSDSTSGEA